MTLTPRPWQVTGAEFLAAHRAAGLFDSPRVGKTGAALLACNKVGAESVAVITTKSGIPVWQRAFDQWGLQAERRVLVSWGGQIEALSRADVDVLIIDECHKAANPDSQRSKAVYGALGPDGRWSRMGSAVAGARRVWPMSGSPAPHDNGNLWPMLRSLAPERLGELRAWPQFRERYCITALKQLPYGPPIPVVVGGRNSDELRERIKGFFLRRTQADVGIAEPTYDLLPISASAPDGYEDDIDRAKVAAAAEAGDTKSLEMMLAKLMRITGEIKAKAMRQIVLDEIDAGSKQIVLSYWHTSVGDILEESLRSRGVVRLDGSTSPSQRDYCVRTWNGEHPWGAPAIFLNQMEAGGEAIDLSAADQMIIVEPVFRPATMFQVAQRIVNVNKRTTPLVRVAVLAGSIDEIVQERLLALWAPIKEVLRG